MNARQISLSIALTALLATAGTLQAAQKNWNKLTAGTYDFNTATNWDEGLPSAGDIANMDKDLDGAVVANISSNIAVSRLWMSDTGTPKNGYVRLTASGDAKLIIDQGGDTTADIRAFPGDASAPAWGGHIIEAPIQLQSNLRILPHATSNTIVWIKGGISEDETSRNIRIGEYGGTTYSGRVILTSPLTHSGGIHIEGRAKLRVDNDGSLGNNWVYPGNYGGTLQLFLAPSVTTRGLRSDGSWDVHVVTSASNQSGNRTITIQTQSGDDWTFGGRLYGDSDSPLVIIKTGDGIQRFGGDRSYQNGGLFWEPWTVSGGTLSLEKTGNGNQFPGFLVNGGTLRWGGAQQIMDTAAIQMDSGSLEVLAGGTFTEILGSLTLNGGTIVNDGQVNVVGTSGDALTMKGGTDLSCRFAVSALADQAVRFDGSGTGTALISGATLTLGGPDGGTATKTFKIDDGDSAVDMEISAPIIQYAQGGSTTISIVKTNAGTLKLTGACQYVGGTVIAEGALQLGANDRIHDSSELVLAGGTFETGGYSDTLATLNLDADSTIDMGVDSSVLTFADSSGVAWNGSLTVTGYAGESAGDEADHLFVGSSDSLAPSQLAAIRFSGFSGPAVQLPTGEVRPARPGTIMRIK